MTTFGAAHDRHLDPPREAAPCPTCEAAEASRKVLDAFETILSFCHPEQVANLRRDYGIHVKDMAEDVAESAREWRLAEAHEYCGDHEAPYEDDEC